MPWWLVIIDAKPFTLLPGAFSPLKAKAEAAKHAEDEPTVVIKGMNKIFGKTTDKKKDAGKSDIAADTVICRECLYCA